MQKASKVCYKYVYRGEFKKQTWTRMISSFLQNSCIPFLRSLSYKIEVTLFVSTIQNISAAGYVNYIALDVCLCVYIVSLLMMKWIVPFFCL